MQQALADPGGGAHPAHAPPKIPGAYMFFGMETIKYTIFSYFFFARFARVSLYNIAFWDVLVHNTECTQFKRSRLPLL